MRVELTLPLPPSVNNYYKPRLIRNGGKFAPGTYVHRDVKRFKQDVLAIVLAEGKRERIDQDCWIRVDIYPASKASDIDNRLKALFDALEEAGVVKNDKLFSKCVVERKPSDRNNQRVEVTIGTWEDGE